MQIEMLAVECDNKRKGSIDIQKERRQTIQKENMYGEIPYVDKKVSRIFFGTAFAPVMMGETESMRSTWQEIIFIRSVLSATGWKRAGREKTW